MSQNVYKNFLDMPAPPGYIPGLGRGATGFTTRSDLGPARSGAAETAFKKISDDEKDDPGRFEDADNEENEDKEKLDPNGDVGLFNNDKFDFDDEEADKIYQEIDNRMQERRKARREQREVEETAEFERNNPSIESQFSDLKRALGSVSSDEWANLPEAGDLTKRNKRQRKEVETRFYAVPDSILQGTKAMGESSDTVQDLQDESLGGALDGGFTDFTSISSARDKILSMRLDQLNSASADTNKGGTATSVDPKGYLTSLDNSSMSMVDVADIKRVRPLLESLVKTDPREARGWIGLARLEEIANKKNKARSIIAKACENCPKSEDVWLENIRLNSKHDAKAIASRAVNFMPKSVKIWLAASSLEDDELSQKKVIQKALENNPTSDTLWKKAVNLESDPVDAKLLLTEAVELVPLSEELWLALARLEEPAKARKVLNRARKTLLTSRAVWIAAARLEEQDKADPQRVNDIMAKGVRELERQGGLPSREQWISEAETCEREGAILTCQAIIRSVLGQGLEEENENDKVSLWLEDAKNIISRGHFDTARAVFGFALREAPKSRPLWLEAANLERQHGTRGALWEVLDKATQTCPTEESFWLIYAREKVSIGDTTGAQEILAKAFKFNPNSEKLWLAAFELEVDNKEYDRALVLMERAKTELKSAKLWTKSIILHRQLGNIDKALELSSEALERYPQEPELYLQRGAIFVQQNKTHDAITAFSFGTKACPQSVELWIQLARQELKNGAVIRARSVLDRASLVNPANELLWLEKIILEKSQDNLKQANILVTKALQECPTSGLLWSELIWLQPRLQRKSKIVDAVKACEHDPYVLITVARNLWLTKKPKVKAWFERAVKADPNNGDAWMWLYRYAHDTGETSDSVKSILDAFEAANPHEGFVWKKSCEDISSFEKSKIELMKETALKLHNAE